MLQSRLEAMDFICKRYPFGEGQDCVDNLYARRGTSAPNFCFAGHTDVVPTGDEAKWSSEPFAGHIKNGQLWGRGAADMKGAIAAFVSALETRLTEGWQPEGSISFLITGDEEGPAINGTIKVLDWMATNGETIDACIVGEPTCPEKMGEMIKIGRRGSMSAWITVSGVQGHSAYPHRAKNPLPAMARLMDRLASHTFDDGTAHFDPSTLAVTTFDTGNPATNVIPAACKSSANVRFNDLHTSATVIAWMQTEADAVAADFGVEIDMQVRVSGESFLTPPGALSDLVSAAVAAETGITPELSTTGGTSDARFVKDHCPVVEFGLVGKTMHQVDECVEIEQIGRLKSIYARVLADYFA